MDTWIYRYRHCAEQYTISNLKIDLIIIIVVSIGAIHNYVLCNKLLSTYCSIGMKVWSDPFQRKTSPNEEKKWYIVICEC